MKSTELNNLFQINKKKNADFIQWANSMGGVRFFSSEVAQHRSGKRKISRTFQLAYSVYFRLLSVKELIH